MNLSCLTILTDSIDYKDIESFFESQYTEELIFVKNCTIPYDFSNHEDFIKTLRPDELLKIMCLKKKYYVTLSESKENCSSEILEISEMEFEFSIPQSKLFKDFFKEDCNISTIYKSKNSLKIFDFSKFSSHKISQIKNFISVKYWNSYER